MAGQPHASLRDFRSPIPLSSDDRPSWAVAAINCGPRRRLEGHPRLPCDLDLTEREVNTADIKEEFVRACVAGEAISLKDLAAMHGRSHQGLRKAASRGRWSQAAVLACAERDAEVAEQMGQRNAITARVLAQSVESDIEVRQRHARLARSLQLVAIERLMALDAEQLSAKLALELLKTGVEVERAALGLGDTPLQREGYGSEPAHVQ